MMHSARSVEAVAIEKDIALRDLTIAGHQRKRVG